MTMKYFDHVFFLYLVFSYFLYKKNKWWLHTTYLKREVSLKAPESLFWGHPNFGGLSHVHSHKPRLFWCLIESVMYVLFWGLITPMKRTFIKRKNYKRYYLVPLRISYLLPSSCACVLKYLVFYIKKERFLWEFQSLIPSW